MTTTMELARDELCGARQHLGAALAHIMRLRLIVAAGRDSLGDSPGKAVLALHTMMADIHLELALMVPTLGVPIFDSPAPSPRPGDLLEQALRSGNSEELFRAVAAALPYGSTTVYHHQVGVCAGLFMRTAPEDRIGIFYDGACLRNEREVVVSTFSELCQQAWSWIVSGRWYIENATPSLTHSMMVTALYVIARQLLGWRVESRSREGGTW